MSLIIQNALIYDGLGTPPIHSDILIKDGLFAKIAPGIQYEDAEIIDAKGLAAAPGFIDLHRHCDLAALTDEDFGVLELAQGITTALCGNCGLAPVPNHPDFRLEQYGFIRPCLGEVPDGFKPATFGEYLNALKRVPLEINIGAFTAAGAVKAAVRGYSKGEFSRIELEKAVSLIHDAMDGGAFGLSMGLMYVPECWSSNEELIALASAAGRKGGLLTCHIRGEGDSLVRSVEEAILIAKQAGAPLHISHCKSTGIRNWRDKIYRAIEKINDARALGQDITVDFYPYTGGSTTLLSLLPPCVLEDSQASTLNSINTQSGRERVRTAICRDDHPGWDNMVCAIGWDRIIISSVASEKNQELVGRSLTDASRLLGFDDPCYALCQLLEEEKGNVSIIIMSMTQEDVDVVACLPYSMVISDSLYNKSGSPHPRLYSSFPKILRCYVRERGLMSMEAAIYKMTGMPAHRAALHGRGIISPGAAADLVLFSPDLVRDNGDYAAPKRLATGIERVIIGGETAWASGTVSGKNAGSVLCMR